VLLDGSVMPLHRLVMPLHRLFMPPHRLIMLHLTLGHRTQ
jgi:hypothetical protein